MHYLCSMHGILPEMVSILLTIHSRNTYIISLSNSVDKPWRWWLFLTSSLVHFCNICWFLLRANFVELVHIRLNNSALALTIVMTNTRNYSQLHALFARLFCPGLRSLYFRKFGKNWKFSPKNSKISNFDPLGAPENIIRIKKYFPLFSPSPGSTFW